MVLCLTFAGYVYVAGLHINEVGLEFTMQVTRCEVSIIQVACVGTTLGCKFTAPSGPMTALTALKCTGAGGGHITCIPPLPLRLKGRIAGGGIGILKGPVSPEIFTIKVNYPTINWI